MILKDTFKSCRKKLKTQLNSKINMSIDSNSIAEDIVSSRFHDHFERVRDATQSSVSLQEDMYASSQIVCVKKHRKGDECNCICSESSNVDRLLFRSNVLPVKKRKRKVDIEAKTVKKAKTEDEDTFESPFCVPVEQHVFVPTLKTRSASKNLYCCVYILQSETAPNKTYCGVTNNRSRRIRQHNGEIVGGAKQTRANRPWVMIAVLNGFQSIAEAQRFEWSMHNPRKRKLRQPYYGVAGRMNCISQLLQHDAWSDRFGNTPIKMTVDGVEIEGTPNSRKDFLLGLEDHCEIYYDQDQLRLYQSNGACLANKTLCELEMNYCKNE